MNCNGFVNGMRNERGAVIALVAVALAALLGIAGLALDSGRAYLVRAELSRATDAAALAAARSLRSGEDVARQRALDVALVNGTAGLTAGDFDVKFGTNPEGEKTVQLAVHQVMPTSLMRVLGVDAVNIGAGAIAAVPPVDLVLVLDQSGSLSAAGAWNDLQDAAKDFVGYFDDSIDQVGLVSFQLRGVRRFGLGAPFESNVKYEIDQMSSAGDTNTGEGLRLAHAELTSGAERERSARVVVFFTDGRPTAFRGAIDGKDRMIAVPRGTSSNVRGYFNNPDNLPTDRSASPDGCAGASNCFGWTEPTVRQTSRDLGLEKADAIRDDGIIIYSIGLGNPAASDPLEVPDLDYLRQIANQDGVADSRQPRGKAYFAPSSAELKAVFEQVANDLLVRLAQ